MELCISDSLQDYASLLKVPELVKSEKLHTNQCDCKYFVGMVRTFFYLASEKREILNYHYCSSLAGNCLKDLIITETCSFLSNAHKLS